MFNKKKSKKKGFTLVELLVVMLIIGVVAAIALPMYFSAVEKSRTSEPMNLLGTIAKAQQMHKLQSNEYTDAIDELDITLKDYSTGENATGSEFDTEYFDFVLGEGVATAARKDGAEYTLGIDYETSKLTCTPNTHKICTSLGLEEGSEHISAPEINEPEWNACQTENGNNYYYSGNYYRASNATCATRENNGVTETFLCANNLTGVRGFSTGCLLHYDDPNNNQLSTYKGCSMEHSVDSICQSYDFIAEKKWLGGGEASSRICLEIDGDECLSWGNWERDTSWFSGR